MLCRVTEKRFYNGVLVGPDTGNNFVQFIEEDAKGKKNKLPAGFEPMDEKDITAEAESQAALINLSQEMADSKVKADINPELPQSGGGAPTASEEAESEESVTADEAAEAIRLQEGEVNEGAVNEGVVVGGAESNHEATDDSRLEKDEDGNVIGADTAIEK